MAYRLYCFRSCGYSPAALFHSLVDQPSPGQEQCIDLLSAFRRSGIGQKKHIFRHIKVLYFSSPPPQQVPAKFVLAPHQRLYLVCEHIMSTNQADSQSLAFASLQSDVKGIAPPSSASNGGNDIAAIGATKDNDHPSSPILPVVTPTDDTKDTILDQPTAIQPPALSPPHHNNVAPSLSSSLTKQALRPPPTSIFPPPSAAAVSATSSSVYHHPRADGRKKLGVAIKATANMYGSMSPSAATRAVPSILNPLKMAGVKQAPIVVPASSSAPGAMFQTSSRLNKFVKRLHDMLQAERGAGTVEWRKGLLVLHSTSDFAEAILPKYFNTKNFKTFRRQLNYYGFTHVRSFSATGSHTTALWLNQELANSPDSDKVSSVLRIKRIDPTEPTGRTAEDRRVRKEEATMTVQDLGLDTKQLQREQLRNLALRAPDQQFIAPGTASSQDVQHHHQPYSMIVHRHTPTMTTTDYSSSAPPSDDDQSMSRSVDAAASVSHTADDAANLLLMLSRATS